MSLQIDAQAFVPFDPVLAPWIIALPLAGAILLLLLGRRLGRASGLIASGAMGVAFVLGAITFFQLLGSAAGDSGGGIVFTQGENNGRDAVVHLWEWISVGSFATGVDLRVDQLSMIMVLVVTGVGALIHVYSIGYMHGEERYSRYFAYLNLFAASMLLLVLADNILLLYVGWEGVGLCSYLLIGFWFERRSASRAANKAFLVNRVGDFLFLLGILLLAFTIGSLSTGAINEGIGAEPTGLATIAALLLFAGATAKSAQIPLYVWLPDAMEGPTPVSALIHAATMVTAGVYMIARLSPVFEASGTALTVVGWTGALTALLAALIACTEYDIKRVLAYSTISQLGYMFLAMGVGAYSAGIFHLVTHAFFKALMFLGAGAVMHALDGAVDMRRMGGLRKAMPVTAVTFMMGWLAISGIVPFSGFFSKDALLASAWHEGEYALWAIGVGTALITAFYMSRLYFRVFEGPERAPEGTHPHDAPATMAAALVPLAILSVIGGVINLPSVLTLEHFLEPVVGASEAPEGLLPWVLAGAALLVAVAGIALARSLYGDPAAERRRAFVYLGTRPLVEAARNKFYVDRVYGELIVQPGADLAAFFADIVDARLIDGLVNGIGKLIAGLAWTGRRVQTGYVRNYALTFFFGAVLIFSLLIFRAGIT